VVSSERANVQALYGIAMAVAKSDGALPELYTENLDAEQIWLQLDMQLGEALKRARRLMRRAGDVERLINPEMEDALKGEQASSRLLLWHLARLNTLEGPLHCRLLNQGAHLLRPETHTRTHMALLGMCWVVAAIMVLLFN
jgi:hypothetical protein